MKQNISAEDWGAFERAHKKDADRIRKWLDRVDYPQTTSGCVLYHFEPIYSRLTIGRMIQYLDTRIIYLENEAGWWGVKTSGFLNDIEPVPELCDALWEEVKNVKS